ncbi:MAG: hypothetical protein QW594_03620 [Candidatus Woesearchaeota archaeon]
MAKEITDHAKKIEEIIAIRDKKYYFNYCNYHGIKPDADKELYQEGAVWEEYKSNQRRAKNARRNIQEGMLAQLEYTTLEHIFYGMHNITIPKDMRILLNPNEELALYYVIGREKQYWRSEKDKRIKQKELQPWEKHPFLEKTFDQFMQYVQKEAANLLEQTQHLPQAYCSPLANRLEELYPLNKDALMNSVTAPYKPSNRQEPDNPNAFYDPNCDGKNNQVYIQQILRKLNTL